MQGMSRWQREMQREGEGGPGRSPPFAPERGWRRYEVCRRTHLQNLGYFLA